MTIENYSDLKSAIVKFSSRSDLSASADDLITLTEGYLNVELRCREMEAKTDLTPDDNVCTLPTDYLEYKRVVELASIRRRLEYITEDAADGIYPTRSSGLACHFMIIGNELTALPLSANDIELTYYQKIPALSDANTTNWLLTRLPNLYLHGCLFHAAELTRNTEKMALEGALVEKYIASLTALDNRAKFGNAGVTLGGVVW